MNIRRKSVAHLLKQNVECGIIVEGSMWREQDLLVVSVLSPYGCCFTAKTASLEKSYSRIMKIAVQHGENYN